MSAWAPKPDLSVQRHFPELEDPRIERSQLHDFYEILTITVCAAVCGTYEWTEVEVFANEKLDWFERFLKLENAAPQTNHFTTLSLALLRSAKRWCDLKL